LGTGTQFPLCGLLCCSQWGGGGLSAETHGIGLQHIQPGKPQQNAYVERYNRTVRHEWLGQILFETIAEVHDHATEWL